MKDFQNLIFELSVHMLHPKEEIEQISKEVSACSLADAACHGSEPSLPSEGANHHLCVKDRLTTLLKILFLLYCENLIVML